MVICIVYYYKNDEIRHSSITSLVRGEGKKTVNLIFKSCFDKKRFLPALIHQTSTRRYNKCCMAI